jgi:type VI secretion system protein VasG
MLREAWTFGSLEYNAATVRTGFMIVALVEVEELARMASGVSTEFQKIKAEVLRKDFSALVSTSEEEMQQVSASGAPAGTTSC